MVISENETRAIEALKKEGTLREQALRTCRYCGITNQTLTMLECGQETHGRPGGIPDPSKRSPRARTLFF